MRGLIALIGAISLCLWTIVAPAEPSAPPSIAAFARGPVMSSVVLSPNGQRLAWISNREAAPVTEVIDVTTGAQLQRVHQDSSLLHSDMDSVVPPEHSKRMAAALEAEGKPFRFVELPAGDHWLKQADSRTRVLTELEKFLAANLAVKPAGGS